MVKTLLKISFFLGLFCMLALVPAFAPALIARDVTPVQGDDLAQNPEQQKQQVLLRLQQEYAEKANQITDHYVKSQQAFFSGNHSLALHHIDRAIHMAEHADLYAFRGAIYFGMGQQDQARQAFQKAFGLDPKLPLPAVAGLEAWLRNSNLLP